MAVPKLFMFFKAEPGVSIRLENGPAKGIVVTLIEPAKEQGQWVAKFGNGRILIKPTDVVKLATGKD